MRQGDEKKAALHTLGCRLNQYETLKLRESFESAGYSIVPIDEAADVAVINTCTVTRLAEAKCRQIIRGFQRRNPNAYVAVVGCYSQTGAKELASMDGVDLILGNNDKMNVLNYIGDAQKNEVPVIVKDRINRDDFTLNIVGDWPYNKRANLKVQDGCDFYCSFCIIPFARGHARSREWRNMMEEAQHMVNRGVRELVLTGVNIGTYNSEERNVVDIVDALNRIDGLDRVRISSIEPTTIPEALFERMADGGHNLMPFFHIPLQSGSDKVLKEMKRLYSLSEYMNFIEKAHAAIPDVCLGTDIMVGFPGESEAEFDETCNNFLNSPLSYCHVFSYSERDKTPAKKRSDHVEVPERHRRSAHLRRLSAKKRHDFNASYIGQTVEVLFEDPREDGWPGYTQNYIRVVSSDERDLTNQLGMVKLTASAADYLEGEVVEVLQEASSASTARI